jgi:hypothetical protein
LKLLKRRTRSNALAEFLNARTTDRSDSPDFFAMIVVAFVVEFGKCQPETVQAINRLAGV